MAFPTEKTANVTTHTVGTIQFLWDGKRWAINSGLSTTSAGGAEDVPTIIDHGNVTTTKTIDVTAAGLQIMTLTAASCTISFTGTPAADTAVRTELHVKHDATTNVRAIVWSGVVWDNDATPYTPDIQSGARSTFVITTLPDGTRRGYHTANMPS